MNRRVKVLILLAAAIAAAGTLVVAVALLVATPRAKTAGSGAATIGGPFTLLATNGQTVSDRTYRGKWLLIYFGYTYCPDACPTALSNISVALQKLGPEAGKLQPLFVTVDPARDTESVMADYLKSFDRRIVGLTGTQSQIDSVIKTYRLYVAREEPETDAKDYLVSHSAYIYLMDPRGRFVDVIQGAASGGEIATWLRNELTHPNG